MVSTAFLYLHDAGPLCFAALWLGSARWVHLDARTRLRNPSGIRTATMAALVLPFLGAVLWACARPAETLDERRERRLLRLLHERELQPRRDEDLRHVRQYDGLGNRGEPLAQALLE